jgi:nickel/cobalt transporter (NicO) family protein
MLTFKNLLHPHLQISKTLKIGICWALGLLLVLSLATPSQAHWADLAVADIQIEKQDVRINLTVPTGLLSQFDGNKDRQLSDAEINQPEIQKFLNEKIQLTAPQQKKCNLSRPIHSSQKITLQSHRYSRHP